ncbi:MAG: exodeoxyribonuclease VII small subunit [Coriobacteriia bacterium]|nr:exodeoxyribonuclease VII small subunit [Coriobacteriia bacterium]
MTDECYTFAQARVRLEEIVAQVRKKDTSLERSLDLLEEGVRLANVCTELSDHTEWRSVIEERDDAAGGGGSPDAGADGDRAVSDDAVAEAEDGTVGTEDADGDPTRG